jgi:hypothetical protein
LGCSRRCLRFDGVVWCPWFFPPVPFSRKAYGNFPEQSRPLCLRLQPVPGHCMSNNQSTAPTETKLINNGKYNVKVAKFWWFPTNVIVCQERLYCHRVLKRILLCPAQFWK